MEDKCGLRDGGVPQATIYLGGTQNSWWLAGYCLLLML